MKLTAVVCALVFLWSGSDGPTTRHFTGIARKSQYVTMRDGVKLAVEVYLPKGLKPGERTATILQLSRYYRAARIRPWARPLMGRATVPLTEPVMRPTAVRAGYSWVDVDVRGTGASFGQRQYGTTETETRDAGDIMDWIVKQPWSAGVIGTTGISYNGTLAVAALRNRHPALKAVGVRFNGWDMYEDLFKPGGLTQWPLLESLRALGIIMDDGNMGRAGLFRKMMSSGVEPVDGAQLSDAVAEHADNLDTERIISLLDFRDERVQGSATFDEMSPSTNVGTQSQVPVYMHGGWMDGSITPGQIRQFALSRHPDSKLRLGPWFHSGTFNGSPYAESRKNDWDYVPDMLAFFDRELRGVTSAAKDAPVHYYTMGEERWKSADTWPPPGAERKTLFLAAEHQLGNAPDGADAKDDYRVVPMTLSPPGSRWGLAAVNDITRGYGDQREIHRRMLTYTTAPLASSLEVTGMARVTLHLSSSIEDGELFVHLGDVAPDGQVRYITEGELRLLHRKLAPRSGPFDPLHSFRIADAEPLEPGTVAEIALDLLPTSYRVPAGHALQIAIGGSDRWAFHTAVMLTPQVYSVHHDRMHPSRIELPTYR